MFRGLRMYVRSPGIMLLGLLPAVITLAVLVAGFVALITWDNDIARLITPFADSWSADLRNTLRTVVELALLGSWLLLSVLLFTAVTLIIGQPFYEAISKRVDDLMGGVSGGDINVSFWKTLPRSIIENIRLLVVTISVGVLVFLIGLVPVAGQILGPVLGALLGGWAVALELTSVPFERRGMHLRQRRLRLRGRRSMALGFGAAAFVVFLVPGLDVLLMPAAVAGATMLARRVNGESEPPMG